jgi:hypothetical protein
MKAGTDTEELPVIRFSDGRMKGIFVDHIHFDMQDIFQLLHHGDTIDQRALPAASLASRPRSLLTVAMPRTADLKIRTLLAPCVWAIRRITSPILSDICKCNHIYINS